MKPEQIARVRASFAKVAPIPDLVASLFYQKLFALDPALKPLFKGDMQEQGRKLMRMITAAVEGLDRLDQLIPTVRALGCRHVAYGVRPSHYDTVGAALLWTLERGLGADFTPEVKAAWATVYGVLAKTMKEAAYRDTPHEASA
jgi:hemoglobin-like flavoprotein